MKKLILAIFLVSAFLHADVTVLNRGVGGHNSRQCLARIATLLKQDKPQIMILGVGANDVLNSQALIQEDEFQTNIVEMIENARKADIRIIALNTIGPVVESYLKERHRYPFDEELNVRIERYNQLLRKIAVQQNILLNDFHQLVNAHGGATEKPESLIRNLANSRSRDGLHLTAAGAKLLGESTAALLKDHIKPGDTILCLGDSITYGASLSGAGTNTGDTYPAWLEAKLNNKPSPSPTVNPKTTGMQIPNGNFESDIIGQPPLKWALAKDSGTVTVKQVEEEKYMFLGTSGKTAFLRTDIFPASVGKYTVQLRSKGTGDFEVKGTIYPGQGGKQQFFDISPKWITHQQEWQEHSFDFEIPSGYNRFCLVIRQRGGNGNFDDIRITPFIQKAVAALQNQNMKIEFFHPQNGGGISSIANNSGVEFVNCKPSGILWEIRMKKIKTDTSKLPPIINLSIDPEQDDGSSSKNNDMAEDDLVFTSADAIKMGARCDIRKSTESIEFFWENIKIGTEEKTLDVRAKFELKADSMFCMADGGFENRSQEYTVFYFSMPQLDGLGAIHNQPADDYLATPFFNGRLINNPVEKNLLNKNRLFQPNRSGHSMQFDTLTNNGNGLYLGSFDPNQYAKRYLLETSPPNGLKWALFNIPDNMRRVPQKWQMPYQAGFRTFQGDWYDGCMIYRDWALKQYWSAEGPITTRQNIPQWFKDIDEWFQFASHDINMKFDLMEKLLSDFGQYKLGAWFTHWGLDNKVFHGMNPDRFPLTDTDKKALTYLQKHKIPVMGYIQCTSWNDLSHSFKKHPDAVDNMIRNYYGQILRWPQKKEEDGNELIAYPGKLWRQVLGDAVVKMAESGFSSAYMDSGNHGGTYLNFTSVCSPESGGGDGYIKQNQQLLTEIRSRARKVNPEFCLNAESFWEGNIAHLDGFLVCNTTNAYLEGKRVTPIPMAQAVYHDYTLMYSVWSSRGDTERDNARGYVAKHALAFCWGVKPGWDIMNLLYKYPNHEEVLKTSKIRHEAYAKGKKYLVYGRMLRKPSATEKIPEIPVKWHISYSMRYYDIMIDKVLKSAWRTPNGEFAAVMYNIDETPQSLTLVFDKKEYQLGDGKFTPLYPTELEYETVNNGERYLLKVNIPPRSPVILEFTP